MASHLSTQITHHPAAHGDDSLDLHGTITEIQPQGMDSASALGLVLPALAHISQERRWLAWIAPPDTPPGAQLIAAGVDPSRVLVVHARGCSDGIRAVENALRTGTCGAVLAWLATADADTLPRLQQAALCGNSWGVVFRLPHHL